MNWLAAPGLLPELGVGTQAFVRAAYGVLMLLTLAHALPQRRRFFLSERWGGYAEADPRVERIHRPGVHALALALWTASALLLVLGRWTVPAALTNLVLCRYFFVGMRWRGVLRGMGAPGFIAYWLAAAVFLLELTLHHAPDVRPLALLVLQVDFAFIFLSAGVYKATAGYLRNEGMQYGMANPQWGYWWRFYGTLPARHVVFRILNQLAWGTEVVAAVLMLIPATRFLGGLLLIASFLFIATQLRLGLLCEMVLLIGVLYFHPGSPGEALVLALLPEALVGSGAATVGVPLLATALSVALGTYLVLLPLAFAGLAYNLYARRALPAPLQRALEAYTNFFGIIIWRVFSADHTDFYIVISAEPRQGGARRPVSRWSSRPGDRWAHVGESIAVTSVFTTLRYYPSDAGRFRERLLRYARTVPRGPDELLVFRYVRILDRGGFAHVPVAEYIVDVEAGEVREHRIADDVSPHDPHAGSPVHEGSRPGSYAPALAAAPAAGGAHRTGGGG